MRKRQSTITEEYSPTFRRRITHNYLSLSLPNTKVIIQKQRESPRLKEQINYELKLKKAQEYLQSSVDNHRKISKIIDMVDDIIRKKMQIHEQELLQVVKSEINRIQEDCRKVVEEYNAMIDAKNKQTEIYNLTNQVEYFKMEALKLFQINRKLTQENKQLRVLVKNKDNIIEELNGALKKTAKKLMREKAVAGRKQQANSFVQNIQSTNDCVFYRKNNIKQEVQKDKMRNNSEIFENNIKSLPTNRFSHSKSNVSTNIGQKSYKRRLYTQMSVTQTNIKRNQKIRNEEKSKSFWKFQPKPSQRY